MEANGGSSDGCPRMHGIWRDILLSEGLFGIEGKIRRLGGQITRKVDDNEIFINRDSEGP